MNICSYLPINILLPKIDICIDHIVCLKVVLFLGSSCHFAQFDYGNLNWSSWAFFGKRSLVHGVFQRGYNYVMLLSFVSIHWLRSEPWNSLYDGFQPNWSDKSKFRGQRYRFAGSNTLIDLRKIEKKIFDIHVHAAKKRKKGKEIIESHKYWPCYIFWATWTGNQGVFQESWGEQIIRRKWKGRRL